jgi:hypothetical protein
MEMSSSTSHHKLKSSITASGEELNSNYPITNTTKIIPEGSVLSKIGIRGSTLFDTLPVLIHQVVDKFPLGIEADSESILNPKQAKRRDSL